MIESILFDLDGTLLDRHGSLIIYVHRQIERHSALLNGILLDDYLAKVIEFDAQGHTAKDKLFQQIEKHFDLPERSWDLLFDDFKTHFPDTCVPFPAMHQTLRRLQERGLSLGLITNGSKALQYPKIDGLGIRLYFGAILVSEAEGIKKPDPEIFHRALRKLGTSPENAVFVGDNPEADIHGAAAAGMRAVWMQNSWWPEPSDVNATINRLSELPEVIDKLNMGQTQSESTG